MEFPIKVFEGKEFIECSNLQQFEKLFHAYRIIHAAGGIVKNSKNEILMIYRRGVWDFPKGKVEYGECIESAARREVTEETGAQNIVLGKSLPSSFHIYSIGEEHILKETHWFDMYLSDYQYLAPQIEEDIYEINWISSEEVDNYLSNSYESLRDLWIRITKLK